ncbi:MAG TPA: hypothetical protein VLG27_01285 [Candidatus Saccharimonadia bacterium]|nr:hypothetical protein [Candidatus Saccharimonadia bacterium]
MISILPKIFPKNDDARNKEFEEALIRGEAKIGGRLFGPVPAGHRREFFCLDDHTWIWHEEWVDQSGYRRVVTTRYIVRPNGIIKTTDGNTYQNLTSREAHNLANAARMYYQRVDAAYEQMLTA